MNQNEEKRLEALKRYKILDTGVDPHFDHLTKLASLICGTPIALISLVDSDRQWFKSCVGLSANETPRNISFCTYAIQGNEVMEVKDTFMDERFNMNPFVTGDPNIRFYAGSPLKTPDGYNLGTLCVIDTEPKQLTKDQIEALDILSDQVVELMELRRATYELQSAKKQLEDQHQILINKARLQSIGELAGGVCHQINNPLAIIVGRSMILRSQLKQKLPEDKDVQKELDVIDQTSQRVSGILKSLRMYAKDFGEEKHEARICEIVEDAITLLKSRFTVSQIAFNYSNNSNSIVRINKNQISQLVLDLINNSLDAMEESPVKNLKLDLSEDDRHVILTVTDSGEGVKPGDEENIFKPFFTTKSRHFGVGLSNAVNFLDQHKGSIKLLKLESPTTFQVKIPKSS